MAIDPNLVTTVQVSELPPATFVPESILAHQIGDILSRGTIQELVNYIRSESVSQPYETKFLTIPQSGATEYIETNFDMTVGVNQGIGKVGGIWEGWAIHNGNNGTYNLDGQTLIGFGANYGTIGQFVGSETVTLNTNQIPSHSHSVTLKGSGNTSGGTAQNVVTNVTNNAADVIVTSGSTGGGQAHNNMQPSMVCLMIYKMP